MIICPSGTCAQEVILHLHWLSAIMLILHLHWLSSKLE